MYCNPPLYSMGGWLLPQHISDTTKERTSSVFPSFLSPSVTPFLCQCYMNANLSLRCISIYTNVHKRFEDVHNKAQNWKGQENPDLCETASNFFLHLVVKKNWMRGVKNTCGGAWEPILFFFGLMALDLQFRGRDFESRCGQEFFILLFSVFAPCSSS